MTTEIPIIEQPPQAAISDGGTIIAAALFSPALTPCGTICAQLFQQSMSLACRRQKVRFVRQGGVFTPTFVLWCVEVEDATAALDACFVLIHEMALPLLADLARFDKPSGKWVSVLTGALRFPFDDIFTTGQISKAVAYVAEAVEREKQMVADYVSKSKEGN